MKKLVWNQSGEPEWVDQTEEELDAEFRANHGGKSADELTAERKFNEWLKWA